MWISSEGCFIGFMCDGIGCMWVVYNLNQRNSRMCCRVKLMQFFKTVTVTVEGTETLSSCELLPP